MAQQPLLGTRLDEPAEPFAPAAVLFALPSSAGLSHLGGSNLDTHLLVGEFDSTIGRSTGGCSTSTVTADSAMTAGTSHRKTRSRHSMLLPKTLDP